MRYYQDENKNVAGDYERTLHYAWPNLYLILLQLHRISFAINYLTVPE